MADQKTVHTIVITTPRKDERDKILSLLEMLEEDDGRYASFNVSVTEDKVPRPPE